MSSPSESSQPHRLPLNQRPKTQTDLNADRTDTRITQFPNGTGLNSKAQPKRSSPCKKLYLLTFNTWLMQGSGPSQDETLGLDLPPPLSLQGSRNGGGRMSPAFARGRSSGCGWRLRGEAESLNADQPANGTRHSLGWTRDESAQLRPEFRRKGGSWQENFLMLPATTSSPIQPRSARCPGSSVGRAAD
jgi:hypothetical protein